MLLSSKLVVCLLHLLSMDDILMASKFISFSCKLEAMECHSISLILEEAQGNCEKGKGQLSVHGP